jgi:DNA-binding IclR family transcriptional regulator
MKTYERVIEALKDGEQSASEISVNALVPASQVSSALRTLQNKGVVGWQEDQGRRVYHLTGVGL